MQIPVSDLAGHSAWSTEIFALCWMLLVPCGIVILWDSGTDIEAGHGLSAFAAEFFSRVAVRAVIVFAACVIAIDVVGNETVRHPGHAITAAQQALYMHDVWLLVIRLVELALAVAVLVGEMARCRDEVRAGPVGSSQLFMRLALIGATAGIVVAAYAVSLLKLSCTDR